MMPSPLRSLVLGKRANEVANLTVGKPTLRGVILVADPRLRITILILGEVIDPSDVLLGILIISFPNELELEGTTNCGLEDRTEFGF